MKDELEQSPEYSADRKDGFVDFDTLRVLRDVEASLPDAGFGYQKITFRGENTHVGIIAALFSEVLQSFNDEELESLTVSDRTVAILDALGIQYHPVHNPAKIVHAEDIFDRKPDDLEATGD